MNKSAFVFLYRILWIKVIGGRAKTRLYTYYYSQKIEKQSFMLNQCKSSQIKFENFIWFQNDSNDII